MSARCGGVLSVAFGLLFVVLAILVGVGSLTGVDQWSVDRLMPGLGAGSLSPSVFRSLFPIFDPGKSHGHEAISAVTYGIVWVASGIPALLLVGLALISLRRRQHFQLAVALGFAFVTANLLVIAAKSAITRPALFAHSGQSLTYLPPFDNSFPSGHETRAVVLVACLIACCRHLWPLAIAWLTTVTAMLVVGGWHTPTDIAGGLLLGTTACLSALWLTDRTTQLKRQTG